MLLQVLEKTYLVILSWFLAVINKWYGNDSDPDDGRTDGAELMTLATMVS